MTQAFTRGTVTVEILADGDVLAGDLSVPRGARGVVVFAHGSGSGRTSPRNQLVAGALQDRGLGTLLVDLLTEVEEAEDRYSAAHRFDVVRLAERLVAATDWLAQQPLTSLLPVAYYGASTGAAAALVAAAERPYAISAVVSRGGRPDLAGSALALVEAPTLLIVGGADTAVIELNRAALRRLRARASRLEIVPGAGHLFEEPGALDQVAALTSAWLVYYLGLAQQAAHPGG